MKGAVMVIAVTRDAACRSPMRPHADMATFANGIAILSVAPLKPTLDPEMLRQLRVLD